MTLDQLKSLFVQAGCTKLYAKPLSPNDNSKNQVYFGPGFQALNLFPTQEIAADSSTKHAIFKAKMNFGWLQSNGTVAEAPGAQLILYPQYPEVRFSGFLKSCMAPPSDLMTGRDAGRILFLGVSRERRVVGFVVDPATSIANEFNQISETPTLGVFHELPLVETESAAASRAILLAELGRVHRLGWIDSKQLDSDGRLKGCTAPQCGGFTLEAELGIPKNSQAEPDFHGWEVKQYAVTNLDRIESAKPITLLTPEPDGGIYGEHGLETFVRKFGYPDMHGRADRLNFGGRHLLGVRCERSRMTMQLLGYDAEEDKITDAGGSIALISDTGDVAASWSFNKILEHWSRKHAKAVYVPSNRRDEPTRQYRYGRRVRLCERTDALRLLKAFASGTVYYDPGMKLEQASTSRPRRKPRSQFRVASRKIAALYESVEIAEI